MFADWRRFNWDTLVAILTDLADMVIVSVGCRKALENPYPAGPEDSYDAAEWLIDRSFEGEVWG